MKCGDEPCPESRPANELDVPDWREALRRAREQGAFVFWNHPGWRGQQPTGAVKWYPEHQELARAWTGRDMVAICARGHRQEP